MMPSNINLQATNAPSGSYSSGNRTIQENASRMEAVAILSQERAKPRDIAWAWVTLIDLENGAPLEHHERRYRKIADAHKWITSLGLSTSTSDGLPSIARSGIRVAGLDDDIEARAMLRPGDVRKASTASGYQWPAQ